jgi:hypothetical protein
VSKDGTLANEHTHLIVQLELKTWAHGLRRKRLTKIKRKEKRTKPFNTSSNRSKTFL